jgi:hypothetical protein
MSEKAYLHFDGMCWPNPLDPLEVEHRIRTGIPNKSDLLVAASFMAAYRDLLALSKTKRSRRCRQILSALQHPETATP